MRQDDGRAGRERVHVATEDRRQRRPGPPEGNVLQLDPAGVAQHLGGHVEGAVNARGREGDLPRTALGVLHEFLHALPGAVGRDHQDRGGGRDWSGGGGLGHVGGGGGGGEAVGAGGGR